MGGRAGEFLKEKSESNYAANRTAFNQRQKIFQSKMKFGKSSTRVGGLSEAQIGSAPTMQFSQGYIGNMERELSPYEDKPESRRRGGLGFGTKSTLLG